MLNIISISFLLRFIKNGVFLLCGYTTERKSGQGVKGGP
jgi:hypothetical protein